MQNVNNDVILCELTMKKAKPSKAPVTMNALEDSEFLQKLIVGIGEVSEITGIPQRQLRYWQEKGMINTVTDKNTKTRRFTYLEIKKILLIKELLDEGYTLDAAARKIEKRLEFVNSAFNKLRDSKIK